MIHIDILNTDEELIEFFENNKEFEQEMEYMIEDRYWVFDSYRKRINDRDAFKQVSRELLRYFYKKYTGR